MVLYGSTTVPRTVRVRRKPVAKRKMEIEKSGWSSRLSFQILPLFCLFSTFDVLQQKKREEVDTEIYYITFVLPRHRSDMLSEEVKE